MQTSSTCPTCNGDGKVIDQRAKGSDQYGQVRSEEVITIDIPAGVEEGMTLTLRGKGNDGPKGGVPGDLLVLIEEIQHDELVRDGQNLHYELFLNFADLALGSQAEIPTISGKAKVKIPEGTPAGKVLRLRGKGLPDVNGYSTGDMLVHVNVWIPKHLSSKEKDLLHQLREADNFKPSPSAKDKNFFSKMKEFFQ